MSRYLREGHTHTHTDKKARATHTHTHTKARARFGFIAKDVQWKDTDTTSSRKLVRVSSLSRARFAFIATCLCLRASDGPACARENRCRQAQRLCVCVRACVRACVCVCVCARARAHQFLTTSPRLTRSAILASARGPKVSGATPDPRGGPETRHPVTVAIL